jgi:dienelactone hydrolase
MLLLLPMGALLFSAVPDTDIRMTGVPNPKTHFVMRQYGSRKEWEARRQSLRQQILSAAGLLPMPVKRSLHPKFVRRMEYPDYSIEVVLLETFPGYFLGGNLYRPARGRQRSPGILLAHGHWKRGRLENLPSYSVPALGINLARQGYVVFAYDMAGYNDTRQTPHSFGGRDETLWSFHPMGLQLWNSMRALDFLQSLPDVDSRRIGATGGSGGASQVFLLAAVDDRVTAAAPVNMVSAYMQGGDPCEEAPNLRLDTFNVEIAAMMAPRPMLVVSSTRDWTRHTPGEEFPALRRIYELYGAPQNVENVHIDAEHNYNRQSREAVYGFLQKTLRPELAGVEPVDRPVTVPSDEEMLAFPHGEAPPDGGSLADLFQNWKAAATLQMQSTAEPQELRDALRYALGVEWPGAFEHALQGNRLVLTRTGRGDRVAGIWIAGTGSPVLAVHPSGPAAALKAPAVAQLLKEGRPVFAIEPFAGGTTRKKEERWDEFFLSYNRSDAAERVQDVVTALAYLKSRDAARPTLVGLGNAGVWCLFAGAIAPVDVEIIAEMNGFGGSDQDFRDRFFIPGIQRAGGLTAAFRLAGHVRTDVMPQ